jgi:HEPN domain-containing protein
MSLLQALELQRQQELTKQAEAKTKEAEFKAQASAYAKVTQHAWQAVRHIVPACMLARTV